MNAVDEYCERVAPGWLGEPANAVTNLAFLVAAGVLLWLLSGQPGHPPWHVWLLPVQLAVIGVCSLAYHTFATSFTGLLDTLSILVFILTAVVQVVHWFWGIPWRWAWLGAPAFVAFSFALNLVVNGALGGYLPALISLIIFGFTTGPMAHGHGSPRLDLPPKVVRCRAAWPPLTTARPVVVAGSFGPQQFSPSHSPCAPSTGRCAQASRSAHTFSGTVSTRQSFFS